MGQYHHPVCAEAEEGLSPHTLGCGLKEGEQGFTRPGTPNAIVALVCARGGNMPADCSQSQLIGRWAGKRVLVQGDYAEDGDIPNWGWAAAIDPLSGDAAARRARALGRYAERILGRSGLHGHLG